MKHVRLLRKHLPRVLRRKEHVIARRTVVRSKPTHQRWFDVGYGAIHAQAEVLEVRTEDPLQRVATEVHHVIADT